MAPLWILLTLLPLLGGAQRFICKGRILGAYYADAKSGCKAFHVCVRVAGGGVRDFRFFCPPGTLFHQEAQTCTDWGDDDPLACPADIYDGQFDLYKIGSVYDTKKLSPNVNREEESEFGLQRAETGDRRLSQNSQSNANNAANDLRAAHSSDFFSGQRDRGRDDSAPPAPTSIPPRSPQPRQSFRRATTPKPTPTTTQIITSSPIPPAQPTSPSQYEISKRKLVRKRPVYQPTPAPEVFPPNNSPQPSFKEQPQQKQVFKDQYQPQPSFKENPQQQPFKEQPQTQQNFKEQQQSQQYFNRRFQSQTKAIPTTTPDVPPQYREYKEEYVEVSRVTPKPKPNRYYPNNPTPLPSSHATSAAQYNKKDSLIELYNYDAQSTPELNVQQNDNNPFKVRNGFSVSDVPREDFARTRSQNNKNFNNGGRQLPTTTIDYNAGTRPLPTTQSYKNYNSVSYEPEKNNFISYSKQNYNNPTTTPSTTFYTTVRPESPQNLNTVAYNTNIGFHSQSNFADPEEDDGQYRPPQGEDDGLYRPELYEKELLSGAHSLNIAASGNRLPEDQKSYSKTQAPPKYTSQTAAPRPFRPAPSPTTPPTTRAPEYTTTVVPQRNFDFFQTYTTTSRPTEYTSGDFAPFNNEPVRTPTTVAPRAPETRPPRPQQRPAQAPTFPPSPRPTTRAPPRPVNKEDSSYDYAYYDSDPGFTEYDHIEEFGRTKKKA